jgi:hypothetical protein
MKRDKSLWKSGVSIPDTVVPTPELVAAVGFISVLDKAHKKTSSPSGWTLLQLWAACGLDWIVVVSVARAGDSKFWRKFEHSAEGALGFNRHINPTNLATDEILDFEPAEIENRKPAETDNTQFIEEEPTIAGPSGAPNAAQSPASENPPIHKSKQRIARQKQVCGRR